ncbi:uncharacterized protein LOC119399610 [Rhipicephalus sanguineus]|uniref:uncharacterized protein LOC119399610 n=1 Tax=Rhipicephalus sanguineus TaxID=34632 RepID=UPI0018934926|nr:uncharacterized protein LOC119399610 [Rhipicephalus sanguineus]
MKSVVKRDVIEWVIETEREVSKGCKNAKEVAFVPLLAAYFGDKKEALFKVFEHGTSITEVVSELPPTPIIAALGTIFSDKCYVACEQELFCEASNFTEAVCIMFLTYYAFNMMYPNNAATTLEFLQRQLFLINPPHGTKREGGQRSRTVVNSRIMKLNHVLRANVSPEQLDSDQ